MSHYRGAAKQAWGGSRSGGVAGEWGRGSSSCAVTNKQTRGGGAIKDCMRPRHAAARAACGALGARARGAWSAWGRGAGRRAAAGEAGGEEGKEDTT
jgi:hypothetical protein